MGFYRRMAEEQNPGPEPRPDDDAWIEKVVGVAGALGFNQMRMRWKLIRWQERRRKARRWREQRIAHIRYEHKTCPECGAVQDRNEAICTSCSARLGSRGVQVLQRVGLSMPRALSMSTLLALALLGVYFRVWIAAGGGLGSPTGALLHDFGGHSQRATAGEPWRVLTAIFLHAGLLHLGFNLIAIATIGPRIEEVYGRLTMLAVFVITGALAAAGSDLMGLVGVGVGASGGVMGLVGAAAGHGQRTGTTAGRGLRNDMVKWAAYTVIFGFMIHADNWAHVFGLLTGAVFGYAVRPVVWRRRALVAARAAIQLAGAAGAIAALAIIFTRTPAPRPEPAELREPVDPAEGAAAFTREVEPLFRICRLYYRGDRTGAIAAAKALSIPDAGDGAGVEELCDVVYEFRDDCGRGPSSAPARPPEPARPRLSRALCEAIRGDLATLPDRPPRPAR
jgi:membrane associated rhomboid family serine protease